MATKRMGKRLPLPLLAQQASHSPILTMPTPRLRLTSRLYRRSVAFAILSFVRCRQRRARLFRRLLAVGRPRRRWLLASVFILVRCGSSGVSDPRQRDGVRTASRRNIARKPWSSWLTVSP